MSTQFTNRQWRLPNNENKSKQSNYSMDFDGTQLVSQGVGNFTSFNGVSECSVSLWFKSSTSQGSYKWFFNVPKNTTGNHGFGIYASGTGLTSHVYTSSLVEVVTNFSGSQWDGNWHHVVLTYKNGVGLRLYYDSVLQFTNNTMSGTITAGGEELAIGGFSTGYSTGNNIIAQIDGVSAFTYALTDGTGGTVNQIAALYGSSSTGIGNPMAISGGGKPVAYYPLGDQDAFNGADYLVPNSSLKDYVFDFNPSGSGDYINIGSSIDVTGNTSFSYWFKANNTTQFGTVLDINSSSTTNRIWTGLYQGKIWAYTGTGNSVKTTTNYLANTWYHITVIKTSSASISNIYINGVAETLISDAGSFGVLTTGGRIGNQISYLSYYTGSISNVQVFNSALPATGSNSVETLYNNGSPLTSMSGFTSLQGWWKLDASELYSDSWSVENNASPTTFNSALDFDGSSDCINISNHSSLEITGNITITAWIKTSVTGFQKIINKRDSVGTNYDFYLSSADELRFYDGSSAISSSGTINLSSWNHVAISIDSGTGTFYINGDSAGTASFTITSDDAPLYIGKYFGAGDLFNGELSNIQVFNTALSSTELETLYNNGTPLTDMSSFSSLVSWWKLDHTKTGIQDSAGSNNGTNNGATEVATYVNTTAGTSSGMTQSALQQSDLSFKTSYSPYALNFSGSGDYIDLNSDITLTGNKSVSFWVNFTSTIAGVVFGGESSNYYPYIDATSIYIRAGGALSTFAHGGLTSGVWYNICITGDGTNATAYLNGSSLGTQTDKGFTFKLINAEGAGYYGVDGKLSNCAIWNTELTQAQVTEIYAEGIPQNVLNHSAVSSLVSWWQLGSNSSFNTNWTVLDEKGSNNGTSVNMTEADIVDGVNSYANGLSSGMGGDEIVGDAFGSSANSLSVNMDVLDRTEDTPS